MPLVKAVAPCVPRRGPEQFSPVACMPIVVTRRPCGCRRCFLQRVWRSGVSDTELFANLPGCPCTRGEARKGTRRRNDSACASQHPMQLTACAQTCIVVRAERVGHGVRPKHSRSRHARAAAGGIGCRSATASVRSATAQQCSQWSFGMIGQPPQAPATQLCRHQGCWRSYGATDPESSGGICECAGRGGSECIQLSR